MRILFGVVALALCTPAFACDGQTGKVIFEDKFTDDSGGWDFSANSGLVLKAPGATLTTDVSQGYGSQSALNQTFNATQGDFCVEMSFPADGAQLEAKIGVLFLAADAQNVWNAIVHADGKVGLYKVVNNQSSFVWLTAANNSLAKTGPTDVNSVRAVVKNGTITVIVNGQTVKSVRAQIPGGDLKFGFHGEYHNPSAKPVSFPVRSYKVTAGE